MSKFDLKNFLTENKLTPNSNRVDENVTQEVLDAIDIMKTTKAGPARKNALGVIAKAAYDKSGIRPRTYNEALLMLDLIEPQIKEDRTLPKIGEVGDAVVYMKDNSTAGNVLSLKIVTPRDTEDIDVNIEGEELPTTQEIASTYKIPNAVADIIARYLETKIG